MPWAAGTSLKPGQAWFPRMDCHGADGPGEDIPANEPCPHGPGMPAPLCMGPQPPDPGGPPAMKLHLLHPKDVELWAGRALKSLAGSMSPGVGVPTSRLLLYGHPIYG